MSKWILVVMVACISYTADAYGDDDKKENKKKGQIKVENKEPKKLKFNIKGDYFL